MTEADIINLLEKKLADKLVKGSATNGKRVSVEIDADDLRDGVSALFEAYQPRFMTLVAVDNGLDIELMYHFSIDGIVVTLRTDIPKETMKALTIKYVTSLDDVLEIALKKGGK